MQKGLHHPYLLRGPQVGGIAAPPLRSHGSLEEGTKPRVATSTLPSPRSWRKLFRKPCVLRGPGIPGRGDKIINGSMTPAFSGAQKWAELLRHTSILKGPK